MYRILMVEDNPLDARLVSRALQRAEWEKTVAWVDDGDKAVRYLLKEEEYARAESPDLVLLDLNLPRIDGTDVLRLIRSTDEFQRMKVFVLSSSPLTVIADKIRSAHVEADRYFVKPLDLKGFDDLAKEIFSELEFSEV